MTLYPHIKQISKHRDQCLCLPYQEKQDIAPEICLIWLYIRDALFRFYFHMNNRNQYQRTYPQCQNRIKRSHGRAIIFNLINSDSVKIYRRRDETAQLLWICL